MAKKNFLLLSLEDDKAKKVANAINNPSCKKILDYLAENDATETKISNDLKLPISTVHYNLKQLQEARLVTWDEAHYSEKGKKVKHYTVANKYIIIAPKGETASIAEKLKSFIPTSLLILLGTAFVYMFTKPTEFVANSLQEAAPMMAKRTFDTVADDAMMTGAAESLPEATNLALHEPSLWQTILTSPAFWFLVGALFTLLVIFIIKKIRRK